MVNAIQVVTLVGDFTLVPANVKLVKEKVMHFICKCRKCKRIVSQCRCPGKDKIVRYVDCCAICAKEKE